MSDRLEKQQQEEALQLYLSQVDDLDQWLLSARSMLSSTPQDLDMNVELSDCQVRALSTSHITTLITVRFMDIHLHYMHSNAAVVLLWFKKVQ